MAAIMLKCTIMKSAATRGMPSCHLKLRSDRSTGDSFFAEPACRDAVRIDDFPNRGDHIARIPIGHLGIERQREQPLIDLLGNRELPRAIPVAVTVKRVPLATGICPITFPASSIPSASVPAGPRFWRPAAGVQRNPSVLTLPFGK